MQEQWAGFAALTTQELLKAKGYYSEYAFCKMHNLAWLPGMQIKIMGYHWGICTTKNKESPMLYLDGKEYTKHPKDLYALLLQRNTLFFMVGCITREKLKTFHAVQEDVTEDIYICDDTALLKRDAIAASTLRLAMESFGKSIHWTLKNDSGTVIWSNPSV